MIERYRPGQGENEENRSRESARDDQDRQGGRQMSGEQSYPTQDRYGAEGNHSGQSQAQRPGGDAQSHGGQQSAQGQQRYGQGQRAYGEDQGEYGQRDRGQQSYAEQGYGQQSFGGYGGYGGYGGRGQQSQSRGPTQGQQGFRQQHYGDLTRHGSADENRYGQQRGGQRDYQQDQQGHEHDLPVLGSGRGPYADLAGYGAYSGMGPDNYAVNQRDREHESDWSGQDRHHGPQPQRASYGSYGQQQSQRDYGAYGAQGYGGEGGSGAQGYGGQGAYGRYGSQSDYGTPGGYGGDRIARQGGPSHETGGGARYDSRVSYGQGAYGGYGQSDMGSGSGPGGQSWGNWNPSGNMAKQQRRGPKGYQRSDDRLKEEICERLMARWDIDSSEVSIEVSSGKVTLEGTVPDRRMRHEMENLIDDCHGVQDIDNHVRVQRSYGSTSSGSASENRGAQYSQSGQGSGSQQSSGSQSDSSSSQSGVSSTSSSGQQNQASQTAAQSGQDSTTGSTLGSTTRSSAPAKSASTEKKDT